MAFPTGPSDGQTYVIGTNQFQYDSATNQWQIVATGVTTTPTIAPRAADPLTKDDGSALAEGDFYYNTTDDAIKTYDGAAWNASGGGGGATATRRVFQNTKDLSTTLAANEIGFGHTTGVTLFAAVAGPGGTLATSSGSQNQNHIHLIVTF